MPNLFQLHPRLQQDCIPVGRFQLCQLLMMNDCQYPWFILVPQISGISEVYQLSKASQLQLNAESCALAGMLAAFYKADKMNIATIGNKVPQLHVHHIVRYQTDKAWPEPVWGKYPALPYPAQRLQDTVRQVQVALKGCVPEFSCHLAA